MRGGGGKRSVSHSALGNKRAMSSALALMKTSESAGGGVSLTDTASKNGVVGEVVDVLPNKTESENGAGVIDEQSAGGGSQVLLDTMSKQTVNHLPVREVETSKPIVGVNTNTTNTIFLDFCQDPELTWACTVWGLLSRLKPGDKIAFLGDSGRAQVDLDIDRAKVWTPLRRALRGDSREALLTFVPGLVAQTVGTTHRLLGQGTLPRHIPQLVLKGVQGLESLRHTYAHDARFLARFDASLSSVRELDAVLGINTSLYLAL